MFVIPFIYSTNPKFSTTSTALQTCCASNSGGVRFVDLPGFKFSLVAETASGLQFAKLPTLFQATLMSKAGSSYSFLFIRIEYEGETMTTDVDDLIRFCFSEPLRT